MTHSLRQGRDRTGQEDLGKQPEQTVILRVQSPGPGPLPGLRAALWRQKVQPGTHGHTQQVSLVIATDMNMNSPELLYQRDRERVWTMRLLARRRASVFNVRN